MSAHLSLSPAAQGLPPLSTEGRTCRNGLVGYRPRGFTAGEGIGIGMSIGVAFGLLFAQLLGWILGLAVAIGAGAGIALGSAFDYGRARLQ